MKYAIAALMLPVCLVACATAHSNATPDLAQYSQPVMNQAAEENEGGQCPVLSRVFMPDYQVMRDQTRIMKGQKVPKKDL